MLGNRVPSNILGPNNDYGRGGWRKLYNEDLRDLFHPSNIIRATNEGG